MTDLEIGTFLTIKKTQGTAKIIDAVEDAYIVGFDDGEVIAVRKEEILNDFELLECCGWRGACG